MTITLTNTSGRIRAFTLDHASFCEALGHCVCSASQDRNKRRIASSLTIPSGYRIRGLPDAVLSVVEIARAVKTGALAVRQERTRRRKSAASIKKSTSKRSKRSKK